MDFRIKTEAIQRVIKFLSVPAKLNTQDFPGRILIDAKEDGKVSFLANNNSTAILIESDETSVGSPGVVSISYSEIKTFVNSFAPWNDKFGAKDFSFGEKNEAFYVNVKNIHENGNTSTGKLKLTQFDVFGVRTPKPFNKATFIINSSILKDATSKVLYAIDPNTIQKGLCGMSIRFNNNNICFAGTNGRLLSEYVIKNTSDLKDDAFILKHDFIMGLKRIVSDNTQVFFEISEDGKVSTKFDDVGFWGKTLLQDYPEYDKHLEDFENVIILDKDVLLSNLLPMSEIFDVDDNKRLTLSIDKKVLTLKTDHALFEYGDTIDWDGDFKVDINGSYLINTVESIKDNKIMFKFGGKGGNVIFDSKNYENQRSLITSIRMRD